MVSDESTRKMVKALTKAGWVKHRTVGSHSAWACPTGTHTLSVVDGHPMMSPGMVRKVRTAIIQCDCKEGK